MPVILANFLLWVVFATIFTTIQLPGNSLFANSLQNSAHAVAWSVLVFIALKSLTSSASKKAKLVAIIISLAFVVGLLVEAAQYLIGRGFSRSDLIQNVAGVLLGFSVYAVYESISTKRFRRIITIVGAVAFIWFIHLPTTYLVTQFLRPKLPILANFENSTELLRIFPVNSKVSINEFEGIWENNTTKSLLSEFSVAEFATIQFMEPVSDWSEYKAIELSVNNKHSDPLLIYIRIDDSSLSEDPNAHVTVNRLIDPGESTIKIPFSEFVQNAISRNLSTPAFKDITSYHIFLYKPNTQHTLIFDDIKLVHYFEKSLESE